jgi:hypothetical protein
LQLRIAICLKRPDRTSACLKDFTSPVETVTAPLTTV